MKHDTGKEPGWRAIEDFRQSIDKIDEQIIALLSKRQEVGVSIGNIKRSLGLEIFDPAREEIMLRSLASKSLKDLSPQAIRNIFTEIISSSRAAQQPLTVAFLGPEATYTHQAAISLFGRSTSFRTAGTIEQVFSLVEKGTCQRGVVPIENSSEGSVGGTLDLLYRYDLKVSAEFFLRIRHHFMSLADDLGSIKRVYSHHMGIAQSRSWLNEHLPGILIKEVKSTSTAAEMAAREPDAAAVGSRLAAEKYNLNLLEEDIEDNPHNITRFLAIGKDDAEPTGRDKTSVLFFLSHKPGALYRALEPLHRRNINMTRIESRPMKVRNWQYLFFVDIEGHERDENVREAVKEMEADCAFLKRLGSFPAGEEPWD
ncbi:MAG: prephenate dehydratase [Thermodesulfobacteriota bacterium]|nr:prephenate dehydratase [Thermodesulfobacteriota bacterium]